MSLYRVCMKLNLSNCKMHQVHLIYLATWQVNCHAHLTQGHLLTRVCLLMKVVDLLMKVRMYIQKAIQLCTYIVQINSNLPSYVALYNVSAKYMVNAVQYFIKFMTFIAFAMHEKDENQMLTHCKLPLLCIWKMIIMKHTVVNGKQKSYTLLWLIINCAGNYLAHALNWLADVKAIGQIFSKAALSPIMTWLTIYRRDQAVAQW